MSQSIYIIAEAGVNHNGSFEMAKKLVKIAKDSGLYSRLINALDLTVGYTEELIIKIEKNEVIKNG